MTDMDFDEWSKHLYAAGPVKRKKPVKEEAVQTVDGYYYQQVDGYYYQQVDEDGNPVIFYGEKFREQLKEIRNDN